MAKIIIDYSQLVISSVAAQAREFSAGSDIKNLVKHIALNQILALKKKLKGDIILACDGRNYWRKSEFKWYKGHRKHSKTGEKSQFDWSVVYETMNELLDELEENFQYTVLKVDDAEADDIIATLCKYFDEHELEQVGLVEVPQSVIIVSTDGDMQQLQKYRHVSQWNNVTKKFMECKNPKQYLIEHIVKGDAGDNVPSITNGDGWARDRADGVSTRAKPFATARLKSFYDKGIDACLTEEERRNFLRNEKLVDLDMIPTRVSLSIINAYQSYVVRGSKMKIMNYLNSHRMKLLVQYAQEF